MTSQRGADRDSEPPALQTRPGSTAPGVTAAPGCIARPCAQDLLRDHTTAHPPTAAELFRPRQKTSRDQLRGLFLRISVTHEPITFPEEGLKFCPKHKHAGTGPGRAGSWLSSSLLAPSALQGVPRPLRHCLLTRGLREHQGGEKQTKHHGVSGRPRRTMEAWLLHPLGTSQENYFLFSSLFIYLILLVFLIWGVYFLRVFAIFIIILLACFFLLLSF